MGRPTSSLANRDAALAFANMATCRTLEPGDHVARRGECSVFSVLVETCPQVTRAGEHGVRRGVSGIEFNKILEVEILSQYDMNIICRPPVSNLSLVLQLKYLVYINLQFQRTSTPRNLNMNYRPKSL